MPTPPPIEYANASPQVRAVFDYIKKTRNVPDVNNFWKYLAHDPKTLKRTGESMKEVMAPGALEPLVKEMIYVTVSASNGCGYCIATHTEAARRAGMSEAMFGEVMADRKSTRLNSSHMSISYAVFCLKKKNKKK